MTRRLLTTLFSLFLVFLRTFTSRCFVLPGGEAGNRRAIEFACISTRLFGTTKIIYAPPLLPVDDGSVTGSGGTTSKDTTDNNSPLEIVYTTEHDTIEKWLEDHVINNVASSTTSSSDGVVVLGLDTESIPNAPWLKYGRKLSEKEGPATLQLSTLDSCLLIHLTYCKIPKSPSNLPAIQEVLQNPSIIKAGVGIDDDALELYRSSFQFTTNRRLDLSCLLEGSSPNQRMGLRPLLAKVACLELPKSKKLSMSNWGAKTLTEKQMRYAAYDAWSSIKIVDVLKKHHPKMMEELLTTQKSERTMAEIDFRARTRRDAKLQWKQLRGIEGEWTEEERTEQDRLWQIMNEMRPDPPPTLNLTMTTTTTTTTTEQ